MHEHPCTYALVMEWRVIVLPRKTGERKSKEEVLGQNLGELWIRRKKGKPGERTELQLLEKLKENQKSSGL